MPREGLGSTSHRVCTACDLHETRQTTGAAGATFFRFPQDITRCRKWVKAIGKKELLDLPIEKLRHHHSCDQHFPPAAKYMHSGRYRLIDGAVPTINLPPPLTEEELCQSKFKEWSDTTVEYAKSVTCKLPGDVSQTAAKSVTCKLPETTAEYAQKAAKSVTCKLPGEVSQTAAKSVTCKLPETTAEYAQKAAKSVTCKLPGEVSQTAAKSVTCKLPETTAEYAQKAAKSVTCKLPGEVSQTAAKSVTCKLPETTTEYAQTAAKSVTCKLPGSKDMTSALPPVMTSRRKAPIEKGKPSKEKATAPCTEPYCPHARKILKKLNKTKISLKSLRKSAKLIEDIKSPMLKEMVLNSLSNQKRVSRGRRWTKAHKIACLAMYKRSPKLYRYLANGILLPTEKTLQNILKKVPMQTGINAVTIDYMKRISPEKSKQNKACGLAFDEMALKSRLIYNITTDTVEGFEDLGELGRTKRIADHALVTMVQGLHEKFKQPIGVYFTKGTISSENLSVIIKKNIEEIDSTGYEVLHTVCDQGSTNLGAVKLLKESSGPLPDGSENTFIVHGKKIHVVFDVPHLFKSIRNNFMNHGNIVLQGKKASWAHLRKMEEVNRNFLYLSKVTANHVSPKFKAKMKVKFAAQALSNTVAAVLKLMSKGEGELYDSGVVVDQLDQLFDATNGPKDIKKGRRQNVSKKSNHMELWADLIKKVSTLKFVDDRGIVATHVKCVEGYITTLKSLRDLWVRVQALGFKYMNLRQLNQDGLENLFGQIRQHSPTNRNPTCTHFLAALKTNVITRFTAYHSRGSNCQKDDRKGLTDFHELVFGNEPEPSETEVTTAHIDPGTHLMEVDGSIPVLSLPDVPEDEEECDMEKELEQLHHQATVYVTGYLARALLKKNDCQICVKNIRVDKPDQQQGAVYNYIKLREWWGDKTCLTYPTINLCHLIQKITAITEEQVCPRLHERHICQLCITLYMAQCDIGWFSCADHKTQIFRQLFEKVAVLLVRRQCNRINQTIAIKEERCADTYKKFQMQGLAK